MAAAEARAAWQRTANRCFVQEDARRAPKLTCCSSSVASSSKSQSDGQIGGSENAYDHPELARMAHGMNPNKVDDLKWWLHIQPCFRHEKDFEQINALEHELEFSDIDDYTTTKAGVKIISDFYAFQPSMASANCVKNGWDAKMPELKANNNNYSSKTVPGNRDTGDVEYFNNLVQEEHEKPLLDREHPEFKAIPWWRTADKDELVSLVAQKSLEHVENCDLPQPQKKQFRNRSSSCLEHEIHASSLKEENEGFSILSGWDNSTSVRSNENQSILSGLGCSLNVPAKPLSEQASEREQIWDTDADRASLLEALCHSQTRARKAEKAAQDLASQKQHVIKLFFKQASQLFAYKQWLHLLQLENICLQLKNKDQPVSLLFPSMLPWLVPKNPVKKKQCRRERSKSVFAFALGLGLAGAGLLLGWTMGWLLPAISLKMHTQSVGVSCK